MTALNDIRILRDLAKQYAELAAQPIQEQRRRLWSAHHSFKPSPVPVLATYGMWNVWCREFFGDAAMKCQDPFFRDHERALRMMIFQDSVGDDSILEPWITQRAAVKGTWGQLWGLKEEFIHSEDTGGAWKFNPAIREWSDLDKIKPTPHEIDEVQTREWVSKIQEAVGDILPVDVNRAPAYHGFSADISTSLARLRGLQTLMMDMYEYPAELHRLLTLMRDGILANNDAAEKAGNYSLTSHANQATTYCDELEWPRPNSGPRKRAHLWGFCAAQEYTLISPRFHEEFLLQYQLPIISKFGMTHYGCCEDLTAKIDMLRKIPNLRSIAVTPTADIHRCAEQIGKDYVISWRPNPTDMVCAGWDETRIRKIIRDGVKSCKGLALHIHLKDVETVQGDVSRLARWVKIVREETARDV